MKKRILSMLLALAMIFSMIAGTSVSVSAADTIRIRVSDTGLPLGGSGRAHIFLKNVNGAKDPSTMTKLYMSGYDVTQMEMAYGNINTAGSITSLYFRVEPGTYELYCMYIDLWNPMNPFVISKVKSITISASTPQNSTLSLSDFYVSTDYTSESQYRGPGWYHCHNASNSYIIANGMHWHTCTTAGCALNKNSTAASLFADTTVCGNTTVGEQLKTRLGYGAHVFTASYEQGTGANADKHCGVCECGESSGIWENHVYDATTYLCVCGAEEEHAADYSAIEEELSNVPKDLSIYTDESVLELTNLINSIDYNLTSSQQKDILELASDIHNAIFALVLKLANYDEVDAAIAAAEEYYIYADNYINFDAVEAAIDEAEEVDRNFDITHQDEVDAIAAAIYNALDALVEAGSADYTEVDAAIAKANEYNADDYQNFDAVEDAIANVTTGLNENHQDEVDAMAKAINDAIDALELKDADYTAVETALMQADECYEGNYTTDSWENLQKAIEDVIYGLKVDKQDEVDTMAQALEDATDALVLAAADVNGIRYATFDEAVEAANALAEENSDATYCTKLLQDEYVWGPTQFFRGNHVLDLNGFTLAYDGEDDKRGLVIVHNGASLTVDDLSGKDPGTIRSGSHMYAAIAFGAEKDESEPATFILKKGNIVGYYYGIAGNGQRSNTKVVIEGGSVSATAEYNFGIFNPQKNSTVEIKGGTISAKNAAIEMRAGDLSITGGNLTASADYYDVVSNPSGTTTIGAAVAISQHTTKEPINVSITGGTITGCKSVSVANPENNDTNNVYVALGAATYTGGLAYSAYPSATVKNEGSGLAAPEGYVWNSQNKLVPTQIYKISDWNWTSSGAKTFATAVFMSDVNNEGKLILPAMVTSSAAEGYITYTASVKLGEIEYTSSKTDSAVNNFEIENGTIIDGLREDGEYHYNDVITVKAADPEEGKYFAGWYLNGEKVSDSQTYKFYLKTNTQLEARYAEVPVELAPLVALELSDRIDLTGGQQQVKLIVRWELPSGYRPVEAGFVRTYNDENGNSDTLTLENVNGTEIKKNSVAAVRNTGSYTLNLNLSAATALKNLHYVGYITCTNAAGETITVYTDLAKSNAKQIFPA